MCTQPSYPCEILEIEGSFNVRDLGGYPTRDHRHVCRRRFIRAGSLGELTPAGQQALKDAGVECVIDLRSRREREMKPDRLTPGEFACHHVPMLDYINSSLAEGSATNFPDSMEEMYIGLLDRAGDSFARIFELFADPRYGSYLFHCTAGKDRTGVTAMLLLCLAGVEDSLIVADYSLSESIIPPFPEGRPSFVPEHALSSLPETMWGTLRHLRHAYGSAQEYLSHIGVTPGQREAVLAKLLVP